MLLDYNSFWIVCFPNLDQGRKGCHNFDVVSVYENMKFNGVSNFLQPIEHPVRTNQIPRQIPDQSIYTKPIPGIIMGGVLPFGCIFIQLFFILNSIW